MNTSRKLRIVVVGGVAGGASAAARARRCNASAEITILEKGPVVSFANCGLPYHLGGEIEDRQKLLVATPELFWNRFQIRVCTGHEVTHVDRQAQVVTGQTQAGEPFRVEYDKLILSTGSEPVRPDFCNAPAENLFQLWTLDDMDRILAWLHGRNCKTATMVGAGFVGLEVVEQLHRRGIRVSLVERAPQTLSPLDGEMAQLVENELLAKNISLYLNANIDSLLTTQNRATGVKLESGERIDSDLVIVGAGVRPRTELAEAAQLTIGATGGVRVNPYFQTDDSNIYAVGDMVEYHHGVLDKAIRVPLAGPANRAGRIAGMHAATGRSQPAGSVQGTSIVRVFSLGAGITGINERTAQAEGIPFRTAVVQAAHHASYFPGAQNLTLKLLYEPETRKILGAQAVGKEGVDKRLDVVATLLHFGGTIDDLAKLDLAYAPPFGSAKDVLHMAAFVAQNDLAEAPRLAEPNSDLSDLQVVDVRNAAELEKLPLASAIHIPLDELSQRWQELDSTRPTVTVCHSGKRAHVAACLLSGKGFSAVSNLNGGMSIRRLTTQAQHNHAQTGSAPQS